MKEIGKIINGDCIEVMKTLPESSIDLICTSPPYGVNINYDVHNDDMTIEEYLEFSEKWLTEAYRVMKDDGRVALNIPYEINRQEKGGRIFFVSEVYQVMKKIGFKFFGIVDLEEDSPHRSKTTAWGSWMSPSSPYQEQDNKEFMELVFCQWKYLNDSRPLTKATFSMDIPTKAIKILSYKNDIVLDPFAGSATTCVAAEILDRRWIGIELSPNYAQIAIDRITPFVNEKRQLKMEV